ncbi:MAG: hypothetical protein M3O25_10845, partial [Actinomycetota bacterium]|nr:hypothetical protein [Actinomycetota bacterium]
LDDSGRHSIVVTARSGRTLQAPVTGDFDRTAAVIVMSGALRHRCAMRDVDRDGWVVRGAWPELDALGLQFAA